MATTHVCSTKKESFCRERSWTRPFSPRDQPDSASIQFVSVGCPIGGAFIIMGIMGSTTDQGSPCGDVEKAAKSKDCLDPEVMKQAPSQHCTTSGGELSAAAGGGHSEPATWIAGMESLFPCSLAYKQINPCC